MVIGVGSSRRQQVASCDKQRQKLGVNKTFQFVSSMICVEKRLEHRSVILTVEKSSRLRRRHMATYSMCSTGLSRVEGIPPL